MRGVSAVLLCAAALCGCTGKSGQSAYNQWVEAFSNGRVSRLSDVVLVLSSDVEERLRAAAPAAEQMSIEPSVAGSWAFADGHTITFHPDKGLDRGTTYRVTADLSKWFETSADEEQFSFELTTLPLLLNARQTAYEELEGQLQALTFEVLTADAEEARVVEKVVSATQGDPRWQHAPGGRRHSVTYTLPTTPNEDVLTLNSAALADYHLEAAQLAQARLPANDKMDVYSVRYAADPQRCVEVTFTKRLDERQDLQGLATLDDNFTEQVDVEGNRLTLYPDAGRQGEVSVSLASTIRSADGHTLGQAVQRTVTISDDKPDAKFIGEGTVVPLAGSVSVPFKAIYMRGVRVKVMKVYADNMGSFIQGNDLGGSSELARVARPVAVRTIFLDEQGADLTQWNTYALDLAALFDAEPGALYRVLLEVSHELSAWPSDSATTLDRQRIAANDEAELLRLSQRFDQGDLWYSGHATYDYYLWNWEDSDDPAKPSYYMNSERGDERNVMATNLALTAFADAADAIKVVCSDLVEAKPRGGVEVSAYNQQNRLLGTATTDNDGLATIAYNRREGTPLYVAAQSGRDKSYLRVKVGEQLSTSTFDVGGEQLREGLKGYLYGERGVWRPGDTLHLAFILIDRLGKLPAQHPVTLELHTPLGQLYRRITKTAGEQGLYTFNVPTSADDATGSYHAQVSVGGATFEKRLRIETIKPNRLKVALTLPRLVRPGAGQAATLHSEWLSGATAANLRYESTATFAPITTAFDAWKGYTFDDPTAKDNTQEVPLSNGRTSDQGDAQVAFGDQLPTTAPGLLKMQVSTRLYEPSGEFSIDASQTLFSPFPRLVGLKLPANEGFLPTSNDNEVLLCAVTPEGKPLANQRVDVKVYKVSNWWWWSSSRSDMAGFTSNYYNEPYRTLHATTDAQGRARVTLNVPDTGWGNYLVVATDEAGGHKSASEIWMDQPYCRHGSDDKEAATKLTLTTDRDSYEPGQHIKLLFPSSAGARALVNICQGARILETRNVQCSDKQTTVDIAATDDMTPNIYLCVNLIQPYGVTANDEPIRLYGVRAVSVSASTSHLKPTLECSDTFKPLGTASVSVAEASGRPMSYTLALVDEGLLDLTHFATPDPWAALNAKEALGVSFWDVYSQVAGAYGGRIEQLFSIGGDEALLAGPKAIVNRFTPVARMMGPFKLDKRQKRRHDIALPNYQGRVRLMVVATDGWALGSADKSVKVSKPLMLLGTAPRQIGVGDEASVSATVFADDGIGGVDVRLAVAQGLSVVGEATKSVNFSAAGDATVTFRVRATAANATTAQVSLTAKSKADQADWRTPLTIRKVAQTVAHSETKAIAPGQQASLAANVGRYDLELAGVQPLNLAPRLRELMDYPHGCAEQTISRAFPQLFLDDFTELTPEQRATLETTVSSVLKRLASFQTLDGGLAMWPHGSYADLWPSAYALLFVTEASAKGYHVDNNLSDKLLRYVRGQVRLWRSDDRGSAANVALCLAALANASQPDLGTMNRLKESPSSRESAVRAALAAAYSLAGRDDVARPLARACEGNSPWLLLAKTRLKDDPQPLAEQLRQRVASNGWLSTYETSLSIAALARFYQANPPATTMVVKATAPGAQTLDCHTSKMSWRSSLQVGQEGPVKVANQGAGSVWVVGTRFEQLEQGPVAATSNGLTVAVNYETPEGRRLDPSTATQGDVMRTLLTVTNTSGKSVDNVAVTHVLPAGFEVLSVQKGDHVLHFDQRDDRVMCYSDEFAPGATITLSMLVSATYAGSYYLPATTAEAMYDARVMGCSASGSAVVQ